MRLSLPSTVARPARQMRTVKDRMVLVGSWLIYMCGERYGKPVYVNVMVVLYKDKSRVWVYDCV